jgi:hypothetical protein
MAADQHPADLPVLPDRPMLEIEVGALRDRPGEGVALLQPIGGMDAVLQPLVVIRPAVGGCSAPGMVIGRTKAVSGASSYGPHGAPAISSAMPPASMRPASATYAGVLA